MAADSLSQISTNNNTVHSLHQSVEKITEIRSRSVAIMINGLGEIERRTIISLIREFEFDNYHAAGAPLRAWSVSALTSNLLAFLRPRYQAAFPSTGEQPLLGVIVGGYSPGQFFPELFQIEISTGSVRPIIPTSGAVKGEEAIRYWGHAGALERIFRGYDPTAVREGLGMSRIRLLAAERGENWAKNASQDELVAVLEPTPEDEQVIDRLQSAEQHMQMECRLRGMPLQEAVEFADYLGQVAIGYDRFCRGNPAVGGELDVVAIQPDGLHWYRRKPFLKEMARARAQNVETGDRDQMRDMMSEMFAGMKAQMSQSEFMKKLLEGAVEKPGDAIKPPEQT
jgi:hypothetical protein